MTTTRRRLLQTAALAAAGAAFAPAAWALLDRSAQETGPPAIRYGADRCDACGMLIGDARFAAAARRGAAVHRYDDIGCLVRHAGHALAAGAATGYVHDMSTEAWLDATTAVYVRSPAIRTPMNTGLAAFASAEAARAAYPGLSPITLAAVVATVAGGH